MVSKSNCIRFTQSHAKNRQELIKQKLSIISSYSHLTNSWNAHIIHIFMVHLCLRKVQLPHASATLLVESHLTCFFAVYRLLGFLHSSKIWWQSSFPNQSISIRPFLVHQTLCNTVRSEDGKDLGSNTGVSTPAKQPLPEIPSELWSVFVFVKFETPVKSLLILICATSGIFRQWHNPVFRGKKCLREG